MTKTHCESCGTENPELDSDGYTTCCNELPCDGESHVEFTVRRCGANDAPYRVQACCAAHAERTVQVKFGAGFEVASAARW